VKSFSGEAQSADEPYLSAVGMLGYDNYDNDINPNDKTSIWPIGSQSTDDIWLEVKGCGSGKALCVQIQPLRHPQTPLVLYLSTQVQVHLGQQ